MKKMITTFFAFEFRNAIRLCVLLAFLVAGAQIAQAQVSKPTNDLEAVQYEIQQINEWLGQISSDLDNHPKTIFYTNKITFLQAVEEDMVEGKSYTQALRDNQALNPESPHFEGTFTNGLNNNQLQWKKSKPALPDN